MNLRISKGITAASCLLAVITAGFGTDARIQRWENRIDRLTALSSKTVPGDTLPVVSEILRRGIESSGNIKGLLERYASSDGSLRADTKKYSITEIESKTTEIAIPVISAWYLLAATDRLSDPVYFTKVLSRITAYANSNRVAGIRAGTPGVTELVHGYILEMSIEHYPAFEASALKKILGRIEYELSRTDYNSNDIDLKKIILEKAAGELEPAIREFDPQFSETLLVKVPEWRLIESSSLRKNEKDRSAELFATGHGIAPENVNGRGMEYAEHLVFSDARSSITGMIDSSGASVGAGNGNPMYSIPDLKKLTGTVDEIDKYRLALMRRIDCTGDKSFSSRAGDNMRGIAEKHIALYESAYRKEELRISGIKKNNKSMIIYNEEVFLASRKHFDEIKIRLRSYVDLSSEFIEAVAEAGTSTPETYMAALNYMSGRYIEYILFMEKLTKNSAELGRTPDAGNHGIVKEVVKDSLDYIRSILKSFAVPADVRKNMTKEQVRELASINQTYRSQVTLTASLIRRNFDEYTRLYNESMTGDKKADADSEIKIAQIETDALFAFAKECSDAIGAMDTTDEFLKEYKSIYETISADIKKNGSVSTYIEIISSGSILQLVKSSTAVSVDREIAGREILAREGNEALTGAVTLCRYYAGRGFRVQLVPTENEIRRMRGVFAGNPELKVASWTMTGRNFREIDTNCTESLRKMTERTAWTPAENTGNKTARETVAYAGLEVSFEAPAGWKKINLECESGSGMKLESPDRTGWIEVYAVPVQMVNLQEFSSAWSDERGFSMVEKRWGRINNEDYFRTLCKGKNNRVSDTRMVARKGVVIIVTGYSVKEKARYLNGVIEKLFNGISF
ncbi:MAG TPA: hypothetical protein PK514_01170 [Spirochaetota bacterium]|nr:hypothetical protein [Spirochaetota bacterium]